ncbi:hypothetical protein [Nocardia sp. NPDC019255]|uniref:hypothetical protein n=1 Tax=Nocardia sp. NPDC019255 TaxID=3154591 RepID=UPI0033EEF60E
MTEPNFELSFLETSAREAATEGRTLVIDPGYVLEALEKLAEARADAGCAHGSAGALHARVMELRAQVTARDARIAELEAAQRPPLGYVVLSRNPDNGRMHPQGSVHPTREPAEEWRQWLEAHGRQFLVAEVREAQP